MIRNFKRVHMAEVEFSEDGLTVIGGSNAQGKSTFLDAVKFLLGGKKYAPSNPHNLDAGGATATVRTMLSNGIEVERSGKSSTLKVRVGDGKGNQATLKEFLNEFALDIDKFMRSTDTEKAKLLIAHLGIGEQLEHLDKKIKACFDDRTVMSREVKRKQQLSEACQTFDGAPAEKVNLMHTMSIIQAQQGENDAFAKKAEKMVEIRESGIEKEARIAELQAQVEAITTKVKEMRAEYAELAIECGEFVKHDTTGLEESLANAEAINLQVDANAKAAAAATEFKASKKEEQSLTDTIEEARQQREKLLSEIPMPLAELSIADGNLIYKGEQWDCMSGSQRLIVATAISRAFKPECGFVLVDELEQMDWDTITSFDAWAKAEGIQVIGAMVCDENKEGDNVIIITDGKVKA